MAPDESERRARRLVEEVLNQGDLAVADELLAPDCVHHVVDDAHPGQVPGSEGMKRWVVALRRAFPDLWASVDDEIAEADRVVQRITCRGTRRAVAGHPADRRAHHRPRRGHHALRAGRAVRRDLGRRRPAGVLEQLGAHLAGCAAGRAARAGEGHGMTARGAARKGPAGPVVGGPGGRTDPGRRAVAGERRPPAARPGRVVAVVGLDTMRFAPEALAVASGERVTIAFRNAGLVPHDLVSQGASEDVRLVDVPRGREARGVFRAPPRGRTCSSARSRHTRGPGWWGVSPSADPAGAGSGRYPPGGYRGPGRAWLQLPSWHRRRAGRLRPWPAPRRCGLERPAPPRGVGGGEGLPGEGAAEGGQRAGVAGRVRRREQRATRARRASRAPTAARRGRAGHAAATPASPSRHHGR